MIPFFHSTLVKVFFVCDSKESRIWETPNLLTDADSSFLGYGASYGPLQHSHQVDHQKIAVYGPLQRSYRGDQHEIARLFTPNYMYMCRSCSKLISSSQGGSEIGWE